MSERGVFAVDRGVFDHPALAGEPFTRREAWLWLVSEAAWKERTRRIGDNVIALGRGQLAASVRFMGRSWGWEKTKVERFLGRLKTEAMIATDTRRPITIITICNYNSYQRVSLPCATETATAAATDARQQRDKREDIKNIETDSEANASGANAPDPSIAERDYFRRGREVLGKNAGGLLAKLLSSKGKNIALARAALEVAATKSSPAEYVGGVVRGPPVVAITDKERRKQEWEDVRRELGEYADRNEDGGTGGADIIGFLPAIGRQ